MGADLRTLTELFSSIPASSPLQYIDISGNHLFGKSAASSVAEDPTQSLYGSTYAARRRLKKLLPSALSDALDSAVSSVNSQWLYRSGSGTAAEEKKQKQKQKLGKTPRTQSNKIRAKGTSVRKRSRFPTPQRTGERKAAVSRNSSAKTASRAISVTKNNPCRDFVREMVKFAYSRPAVQQATELDTACIDDLNLHCDTETDATTSVESSSSTSQVSDNDILPPSPAAAAVYIGLAKTGLDDAFAHDLARTMTAQRKQATGLSGVTKKWVLRLGCELNDLSDRALEAIFKKTQTCKIIP